MKKSNKEIIMCPVCGEQKLKKYFDICQICGWVHDFVQLEDPSYEDAANKLSLNESKEFFELKRLQNSNYMWKEDAKNIGNPSKKDLELLRETINENKLK